MATVLVIDGSILIYQQFNSVGHLATKSGVPTGLRFGFLRAVAAYVKKFDPEKVLICWDADAPVKKAEGLEHYKANRKTTPEKEKMWSQVPDLKEMLGLTFYTQVWADGYEADDVIGTVARQMRAKLHKVIVVTSDNDMSQLIDDDIMIYVPGKDAHIKTRGHVLGEYGVGPEFLVYYRAAAGDPSDNLPRVLNTAMLEKYKDYLTNHATLTDESSMVKGTRAFLARNFNIVQWDPMFKSWLENLKVMQLHKPESLSVLKGKRDQKALLELFGKLEFKSMLARVEELTRTEDIGGDPDSTVTGN